MAPEILVMSKIVYDKLPKAEQDMIRAAAKASVAFQRQKWDEQEAKSLANVKAAGAQIVEVDKASFQASDGPGVRQVHRHHADMKRLVKAVQDTEGAAASLGRRRRRTHAWPVRRAVQGLPGRCAPWPA
jgi:TRAP-type C4-dicarboxylate transport system substrate-binding protein